MQRKSATTLKDVAKEAGVSLVAASVVVNGSRSNSRISEATRERILKAAGDLRYSPNTMARGLKRVRLNTLGVSFHSLDADAIILEPYSAVVLGGIVSAAHRAAYNVTLFHKPWHDAHQSASSFRDQGIDGFLIVAPTHGSDMVSGLAAVGIPLIVISSSSDQYGVPSVDVDNEKGVRQAIEHLLSQGHRRIAHVMNHLDLYDTAARRDTFLRIMAENGISVPSDFLSTPSDELRVGGGTFVPQSSYERARHLLTLPEPPTAIFTTNDTIAAEVVDAARDLGIRIPEHLSIVGFDDSPKATQTTPQLTTVRQPLWDMGQAATRLLISLVEGEPVLPKTHLFVPELIVRGSTMPPSS